MYLHHCSYEILAVLLLELDIVSCRGYFVYASVNMVWDVVASVFRSQIILSAGVNRCTLLQCYYCKKVKKKTDKIHKM